MSHVHERCIAHRDLKLENLLLAERSRFDTLKVADFGLARRTKTSRGKLSAQCGSPAYVAPEIILEAIHTPAVDMWACGVIMYALLTGELPFTSESEREMYQKIIRVDARGATAGGDLPAGARPHLQAPRVGPRAPSHRGGGGRAVVRDGDGRRVHGLGVSPIRRRPGIASQPSHRQAARARDVARRARRVQRDERDAPESDPFERRAFAAGARSSRGDRAREVMLIESGEVEVSVTDENTGAKVAIGTRGAGEYVGEMAIGVDAAARDARRRHGGGGARGAESAEEESAARRVLADETEGGERRRKRRERERLDERLDDRRDVCAGRVDAREARLGGRAAVRGRRGDDGDARRRHPGGGVSKIPLELLRPRRGGHRGRAREGEGARGGDRERTRGGGVGGDEEVVKRPERNVNEGRRANAITV